MTPMRLLWTALGYVALTLGIIGVALPVVPTTPFMILAAFAFGKGSPRMRRWLERNRHFGPAIRDWETRGAIRPRHKAVACLLMSGSLIGAVLLALPPAVLAVQAVALAGAAAFMLTRPSA
ncbi:YbaN family protein [Rubellimicrobium aerolatum]|uniref:YbaN family protein n=1 Tax=Rubellimicrobium aerolatum TaxID=490979 RepID=A0ABW0S7X4_9RHOB|nr:YbaN family protein [Rubellimicrobium aerolatum]MBP1804434.1 uncharacterized membrane protein YbaN (DUF454 family) [Rubellimicrobium aerolatum]